MENGNTIRAASLINKPFVTPIKESATKGSMPFSDVLGQALKQAEIDNQQAEELTKLASVGEVKDLHQVMIAMEKANISLQLAVQVKNKVVEAYQEIMRMQV